MLHNLFLEEIMGLV